MPKPKTVLKVEIKLVNQESNLYEVSDGVGTKITVVGYRDAIKHAANTFEEGCKNLEVVCGVMEP
jgi:hypothetical protein